MPALRLMGAVHRLVLAGEPPDLAGGTRPRTATLRARPPFSGRSRRAPATCAVLVEHPVQTNETARCTALLPGFLAVAPQTGLPPRLLEVGASAASTCALSATATGGERTWGPPGAEPDFARRCPGSRRRSARDAVAARAGCDARPSTRPPRMAGSPFLYTPGPTRPPAWTRAAARGVAREGPGRRRGAG